MYRVNLVKPAEPAPEFRMFSPEERREIEAFDQEMREFDRLSDEDVFDKNDEPKNREQE